MPNDQCTNSQILKHKKIVRMLNEQIAQCTNAQNTHCTNAQCTNAQCTNKLHKCSMSKFTNAQMHKRTNAQNTNCTTAQCANSQMQARGCTHTHLNLVQVLRTCHGPDYFVDSMVTPLTAFHNIVDHLPCQCTKAQNTKNTQNAKHKTQTQTQIWQR